MPKGRGVCKRGRGCQKVGEFAKGESRRNRECHRGGGIPKRRGNPKGRGFGGGRYCYGRKDYVKGYILR